MSVPFQIVPEFRDLLTDYRSTESFTGLVNMIRSAKRVIKPYIAWECDDGSLPLIDGHHREDARTALNAEGVQVDLPEIIRMKFDNAAEAKAFAIQFQDGQRPEWTPLKAQLRIQADPELRAIFDKIKADAAKRKKAGKQLNPDDPNSDRDQGDKGDSLGKIAKKMKVSRTGMWKAEQVAKNPMLAAAVEGNILTLNAAHEAIKVIENASKFPDLSDMIQQLVASDPKERISLKQLNSRYVTRNEAAKLAERNTALGNRREQIAERPKPVTSDGDLAENQIHLDDAIVGLKRIKSGSASLVMFSAPYPLDTIKYDCFDFKGLDALLQLWKGVIEESYRVLRPGGRILVNIDDVGGGDPQINCYYQTCRLLEEAKFHFYGNWCWYKQNSIGKRPNWGTYESPEQPRVRRQHEHLIVYCKETPKLEGQKCDADIAEVKEEFEKFTMSHWYIPPAGRLGDVSDPDFHPCPYPEELAYRAIKLFTFRGDLVVDPFSGSGTTSFVAAALGRQYIGIDNSPLYCDSARRRIAALDGLDDEAKRSSIARFIPPPDERSDGYGAKAPRLSTR